MEDQEGIHHLVEGCNCSGKRCSQCKQLQCVEGYHRQKLSSDGRRAACKICRKAEMDTNEFRANRRARYKENAEQINETKRAWYHANPEKGRQYSKDSRQRHPEQVKAYEQEYNRSPRGKERDKRYRERHPERVKEIHKKSWRKHHDARISSTRAYHANKRTQKTGAGGSFTADEWETLKGLYNYTCPSCGRSEPEIQLTVDHKQAVIKLGTSAINNIQPLCLSCNSRKGTKFIDYGEDNGKKCG